MLLGILVCLNGPWFMPDTTRIVVPASEVVNRAYDTFPRYFYEDPNSEGWAGIEICEGITGNGNSAWRAEYFQYTDNQSINSLVDEM